MNAIIHNNRTTIMFQIQMFVWFIFFHILLCFLLSSSSSSSSSGDDGVSSVSLSAEDKSLLRLYDEMVEKAKHLNKDNQFVESEAVFKQVVDGFSINLGASHPKTLSAIRDFAISFTNRNKQLSPIKSDYEKAIYLLDNSMAKFELAFGKDSTNVIKSVSLLSLLYRALQRNEEAKPLFERIFQSHRLSLGESHEGEISFFCFIKLVQCICCCLQTSVFHFTFFIFSFYRYLKSGFRSRFSIRFIIIVDASKRSVRANIRADGLFLGARPQGHVDGAVLLFRNMC